VLVVVTYQQHSGNFGIYQAAKLSRKGFLNIGRRRSVGKGITPEEDKIDRFSERSLNTC
jgi:hypothetical protein